MRRFDGMCPKCGVRPRPTEQHSACRQCKAEDMRQRRKSNPRVYSYTARGMECSKAPPPPPGFNERDTTLGRPYA
jgi:hypothetical protein